MVTSIHGSPVLEAVRTLATQIRAAAPAIEDARRLSPEVVAALKAAGVFGMCMPRSWGGEETPFLTQLDIIEELAAADGATGWCAMINSDGAFVSSFLKDEIGREMYNDLQSPTVFVIAPGGAAVQAPGGYRVSGRWPFASGCQHAAWFALGCVVPTDSGVRTGSTGVPELRVCVLAASDVQILDTWDTTGLRGSGSHDVLVSDVSVPEERTFIIGPGSSVLREGGLYRWGFSFVVNLPAVAIGIARGAIEDFVALAPGKKGGFAQTMLAEERWAQSTVARAEAKLQSARAYYRQAVAGLQAVADAGEAPDEQTRAQFWLAAVHAADSCREVVDIIHHAAGSAALKRTGTLDRRLRDICTLSQHASLSPGRYEAVGRVLLGRDAETVVF